MVVWLVCVLRSRLRRTPEPQFDRTDRVPIEVDGSVARGSAPDIEPAAGTRLDDEHGAPSPRELRPAAFERNFAMEIEGCKRFEEQRDETFPGRPLALP